MAVETYTALDTYTTLIAGQTSSPTLKNLANNAQVLGNEVDPTSNRYMFCDIELKCRFQTAPTAGAYVALHFIQALDGTNYEDGDASVTPLKAPAAVFPVRLVNTQQRLMVRNVLMPATKFKPLLINKGGYALTNTDDENILSYRQYTVEVG